MNASTSDAAIVVGKNVQVSTAMASIFQAEVMLGADPVHEGNLIACTATLVKSAEMSASWSDAGGTAAYISHDRGEHWELAKNYATRSWDPNCGYDSQGNAYFIAATSDRNHEATLVLGNGNGWGKPIVIKNFEDRPWATIAKNGTTYVAYHPVRALSDLSYGNVEALSTFRPGSRVASSVIRYAPMRTPMDHNLSLITFQPLILSSGDLIQPFDAIDSGLDWSNQSNDLIENVHHLPPERNMPRPNGKFIFARIASSGRSAAMLDGFPTYGDPSDCPAMAVDSQSVAFRGNVYIAWSDIRSGRFRVYVARSLDNGKTWSTPFPVDDALFAPNPEDGPDNLAPAIAVNKDGVVGVMWEDARESPTNDSYYIRFSASLDGGLSWLPSVRVSEAANRPNDLALDNFRATVMPPAIKSNPMNIHIARWTWPLGGDTNGLAADAGGDFHPLWIDNRTGIAQVWTASVAVHGTVHAYLPQVSGLIDVSSRVQTHAVDGRYDRRSGKLWLELQITNTTTQSLNAVRIEVLSLTSPSADITSTLPSVLSVPGTIGPNATRSVRLEWSQKFDHNPYRTLGTVADLNVRIWAHPVP